MEDVKSLGFVVFLPLQTRTQSLGCSEIDYWTLQIFIFPFLPLNEICGKPVDIDIRHVLKSFLLFNNHDF